MNFAGLFPWVDVLFGTRARQREWPQAYGCDAPVPRSWWQQIIWPFRGGAIARGDSRSG